MRKKFLCFSQFSKTIQKFINHLLDFIPDDSECLKWMDELNINSHTIEKTSKENNEITNNINNNIIIKSDDFKDISNYEVDKSMATLTMVKILKKQKYYHQALSILENLDSKNHDQNTITHEKNELLKLISKYSS